MTRIPTSLRLAIAFVVALWSVGLIALAFDAPREIVMVTAIIGTASAVVEWSSHRPERQPPS